VLDRGIDIVVTSPTGHTDLVVEVKQVERLEHAATQVRDYMRRVGAAVGLVVGAERILILRETYRGEPSIQVVGDFPLDLAHGLKVSSDPLEFEERVQRWLEMLARTGDQASEPLLSSLHEHVLPVLADGTVSAAGPRIRIAR
jgi:hypothetical protein